MKASIVERGGSRASRRRTLLLFLGAVVTCVFTSLLVGSVAWLVLQRQLRTRGVEITGRAPLWFGTGFIARDVTLRRPAGGLVFEGAGSRLSVWLSWRSLLSREILVSLTLDGAVIDIVMGDRQRRVLDYSAIKGLKTGRVTVAFTREELTMSLNRVDVLLRDVDGSTVAWLRDVEVTSAFRPQTELQAHGLLRAGLITSEPLRVSGVSNSSGETAASFALENGDLQLRDLGLHFTKRATLTASASVAIADGRFTVTVPAQRVELLDVLAGTTESPVDFADLPSQFEPSHGHIPASLQLSIQGTALDNISGNGVIELDANDAPDFELLRQLSDSISVNATAIKYGAATIKLSVRDGVASIKPTVFPFGVADLCIGGSVSRSRNRQAEGLWALVRVDVKANARLRLSQEIAARLNDGFGRTVLPIRLGGSKASLALPPDLLEELFTPGRTSAVRDKLLFGALAHCWPTPSPT
ncbi:MAG: hypothetical protein HY048_19805 [Acidobacteria bacterium]|nr:hypothetical protein [Acidobacteriota bacterium]